MDTAGSQPQTAVSWAFKAAKKYKTVVRFVLVALAEFIDTGNACPSHVELATNTGLARSTVQGALGELEKDGTIEHTKNGGSKVRGGKTNCYRLVGWVPVSSPVESTPQESIPVESVPGGSIPPESSLSTEPAEYAPVHTHESAADTRDAATRVTDLSFTEQKELKEFDATTNSLMLEDTRAVNAPMTEAEIQQVMRDVSPEARPTFAYAASKAGLPTPATTNAPNPNVPAAPLPPPVDPATDAYVRRCGYSPAGKEQVSLDALIKLHGTEKTAELIRDCDKQDWQGLDVKNPAGYVLKTGNGKTKSTWQPKPITPAPVAPDYTVSPERRAFDDMLGEALDRYDRMRHEQA